MSGLKMDAIDGFVEDQTLQPSWSSTPATITIANLDTTTTPRRGVVFLAQAHISVNEGVSSGVAEIPVYAVGGPPDTAVQVSYRLSTPDNGPQGGIMSFTQTPGSDYATPSSHGTNNGGLTGPIDFTIHGGLSGTATIPASPGVGFIRVPLNNDSLTEFPEDFLVTLIDDENHPSPNPYFVPPDTDGWVGGLNRTTVVTIENNDSSGLAGLPIRRTTRRTWRPQIHRFSPIPGRTISSIVSQYRVIRRRSWVVILPR